MSGTQQSPEALDQQAIENQNTQNQPENQSAGDVTHQAEPSTDPVAELAKQLGWNPDHPGDGAVDAKTYILRSRDIQNNMHSTIRGLRKELDAVREGVEAVRWSSDQARKRQVSQLKAEIDDLKRQRKQAFTDQDADRAEAIDDKIDALKEQMQDDTPPQPKQAPQSNPAFDAWAVNNSWYNNDDAMTQFANAEAARIEAAEGRAVTDMAYRSLLTRVRSAVETQFPDRFPKPAPVAAPNNQPAAVAQPAAVSPSRQRPSPAKTKATAADLSHEQRDIGKAFILQGIYKDLDEYAQTLQNMLDAEKK